MSGKGETASLPGEGGWEFQRHLRVAEPYLAAPGTTCSMSSDTAGRPSGGRHRSVVSGAQLRSGGTGIWFLLSIFCPHFHRSTCTVLQATCIVTFRDFRAFCLFLVFCFVDVISQIQGILY